MTRAWQQFDLDGGGLQGANLALARRLKRRRTAYALLALAPSGLHRRYLDDRRGAWAWPLGAAIATGIVLLAPPLGVPVIGLALAAVACDAWWIDRRLTVLNKRLRRETYLGRGAAPPAGFTGRVTDEDAGRAATRSFAEQSRRLHAQARARHEHDVGGSGA